MASSSFPTPSRNPNPQPKYDVFLSFRSEDTGSNFTSHLHDALCRENIETFIDYRPERGLEISQMLSKTIEESKISLVIFSKGYASSSWCLDELVQILECKRSNEQIVLPIFYDVDPSDVRCQTGCFAEAFAKHALQFKDRAHKVERWRAALTEVANIAGYPSKGPEAVLVNKIVRDILGKLNYRSPSVGREERTTWQEWMASFPNDIWSTTSFFVFFFFLPPFQSRLKRATGGPSQLLTSEQHDNQLFTIPHSFS